MQVSLQRKGGHSITMWTRRGVGVYGKSTFGHLAKGRSKEIQIWTSLGRSHEKCFWTLEGGMGSKIG